MANPSLVELLAPVIGLIESRLTLLPSLSRLSGRLELLTSQLDGASGVDENASPLDMQTGLLTYQDAGEFTYNVTCWSFIIQFLQQIILSQQIHLMKMMSRMKLGVWAARVMTIGKSCQIVTLKIMIVTMMSTCQTE